jgi:hypothetical protein
MTSPPLKLFLIFGFGHKIRFRFTSIFNVSAFAPTIFFVPFTDKTFVTCLVMGN